MNFQKKSVKPMFGFFSSTQPGEVDSKPSDQENRELISKIDEVLHGELSSMQVKLAALKADLQKTLEPVSIKRSRK